MRIGSAVIDGNERVVVQGSDGVHATTEPVTMIDVITDWPRWRSELEGLAESSPVTDLASLRWLAPVRPEKLICVGTNYRDHVAEMEAAGAPPARANVWPYGFFKSPSTSLVGHDASVALPSYAEKIDWEVELALVIGDGSKAGGDEPLDAVFGYSVLNDLSVRDFVPFPHALGMDTIVAKGFDGSAPMGPWIVTADEIDDPQNLPLQLRVNGVIKQDSSTSQMIFGLREILAHFARILTLRTGDVIATGTPSGVGIARRPPETLAADDVVEAEIDGIGLLRTTMVQGPDAELLKA
jgi:2-keto-4-pentenoate hydratase/2-oxohepta-3-ene-1,7-dioic acid hydratase in catechol pathway